MSKKVKPADCPSGKKIARTSVADAATSAASFARSLNANGWIAYDLYAYRCARCRHFHLTRMAEFPGVVHVKVFTAPPVELQRWAMPPSPATAEIRRVHEAAQAAEAVAAVHEELVE